MVHGMRRLVHECSNVMFFFFKQKTAYEMRISDWSSDVCSSDLERGGLLGAHGGQALVDLGVHARHEERRDGLQGGDVVPGCLRLLDTGEVRVDDLEIGRASCRDRVCQYV